MDPIVNITKLNLDANIWTKMSDSLLQIFLTIKILDEINIRNDPGLHI